MLRVISKMLYLLVLQNLEDCLGFLRQTILNVLHVFTACVFANLGVCTGCTNFVEIARVTVYKTQKSPRWQISSLNFR